MFLDFFLLLKNDGLPVTIREYLDLLGALEKNAVEYSVDDFYYLCRTVFIKNEQHLDRFDQLFGKFFKGIETVGQDAFAKIPDEWLRRNLSRVLTEAEKAQIEAMGGLDKMFERLRELLQEQKKRHEGGNRWIGTGGTSPFGAYGFNPGGVRIGPESSGNRSAVKVWDMREFKGLNDDVEINTRNMKMALKRLRILTREGMPDELDIDGTIKKTADNAGILDLEIVPQKRNNVKVLMFFDIGGSMDDHIELCERLFSAAKYQFKHLEYYYFHNCLYERVWRDNARRWRESIPTFEVLNKYNNDYKVIIVGDASMAPYELSYAGGSVEHMNDESGMVWLGRLKNQFPHTIWLNPVPRRYWRLTQTIQILQKFMNNRMFPMTLAGLTQAMKALKNRKLTALG